ncbi:MAG TPA: hypothetical protein EYP98_20300, partial [Planctomycetes bacterium]|nr:hypothetical protein [Planctomycetota bacterium]
RIARLDRDVASRKGQLADILADVEQGNTQILVGTQILTKGHDFPGVTLVGVLNADQGLLGADFRSNERLAQTLLQVAGRAGRRDQPGEVLIQTHYPAHPLLTSLIEHDYTHFAELALEERAQTRWPPFSHLSGVRRPVRGRPRQTFFSVSRNSRDAMKGQSRSSAQQQQQWSGAADNIEHNYCFAVRNGRRCTSSWTSCWISLAHGLKPAAFAGVSTSIRRKFKGP